MPAHISIISVLLCLEMGAPPSNEPLPPGAVIRLGSLRFRNGGAVRGLAYSPDGKLLASGGAPDGSVCLWNAASGTLLRRLEGHSGRVSQVVFAPDGRSLATAGGQSLYGPDKTVRIWDVQSGRELKRFDADYDQVNALAYSPDGKLLAVGSGTVNGWVRLYDPSSGIVHRTVRDRGHVVWSLAFSPDGKSLVVGGTGRELPLYQVETGEITKKFSVTPGSGSNSYVFSPDGQLLAGANAGFLIVWDLASGESNSLDVPGGHTHLTRFSPDGKLLVVSQSDGTVRVFDRRSRRETLKLTEVGVVVAVSPDSKHLATGGGNGVVRVWDIVTGREVVAPPGHQGVVVGLGFFPDSKTIASTSSDNRLCIWDLESGKQMRVIRVENEATHYRGFVRAMAVSPDGQLVATVSSDSMLRLWAPDTGRMLRELRPHRDARSMFQLAFSPDSKSLVVASWARGWSEGYQHDIAGRIWRVADGTRLWEWRGEQGKLVDCLAVSSDGHRFARETSEHLLVESIASPRRSVRIPNPHHRTDRLLFAPAADLLLLRHHQDASIHVRESWTGRPFFLEGVPTSPLSAVNFSSDGRILAAAHRQEVSLWDLASGKKLGILRGHRGDVEALSFSVHEHLLATGGADATVLVWDLHKVKTAPPSLAGKLTETERAQCWEDLAGEEVATAQRAGWTLAYQRGIVAWLNERLRPATAPNPERVKQWIAALDHDQFAEREAAMRELASIGFMVEEVLRKALQAGPSLEARRRLEKLLEELAKNQLTGEELRHLRAVMVLERVGTAESATVLRRLASGAKEALLTQEAAAALHRVTVPDRHP